MQEAAERVGIAALLDRKPRQLSGGQQQRVAIARALVRTPSVFLFDEPLSNLDAKLRVELRTEIRKHPQQESGITALYVTHDQEEAMTIADRLVVVDAGRIVQQGTPEELYRRPVNTFVAGFIGSPEPDLVPGRLRRRGTVRSGRLGVACAIGRETVRVTSGFGPRITS